MPQCQKKNQVIEIEYPDNLPHILCDTDKITQVLVNLVGNAHKFTPEAGTINVRATISAPLGDFITVTVEDSGCGISAEDQELIWGKFTQV